MTALTVWTDQGIVDMVAVSRWLRGEEISLNAAEHRVAYAACRDGHGHAIRVFQQRTGFNMTRYQKLPDPRPLRGDRATLIPSISTTHQKAG